MTADDRPKSAVELAMERMRQRDADSGVVETPSTDKQKADIAEARVFTHRKRRKQKFFTVPKWPASFDPDERTKVQDDYRRGLQRLNDDLERKDPENPRKIRLIFGVQSDNNVLSHILAETRNEHSRLLVVSSRFRFVPAQYQGLGTPCANCLADFRHICE